MFFQICIIYKKKWKKFLISIDKIDLLVYHIIVKSRMTYRKETGKVDFNDKN